MNFKSFLFILCAAITISSFNICTMEREEEKIEDTAAEQQQELFRKCLEEFRNIPEFQELSRSFERNQEGKSLISKVFFFGKLAAGVGVVAVVVFYFLRK